MNGTRLLVSVRSAVEAAEAVEAGADLIDVKEPRSGSLGTPAPHVVAEVLAAVAGRRAVSVALGELKDHGLTCDRRSTSADQSTNGTGGTLAPQSLDASVSFAKLGLAGCAAWPAWEEAWQRQLRHLTPSTAAVAVIYADWPAAGSPMPQQVLAVARRLGCRAVLVDTFDKTGPGLMRLWSLDELRQLADAVRQAEMLLVLGGKLLAADFDRLLPLRPDFLAVRGAVCRENRAGRLDADLVRSLSDRLRAAPAH
jgi:(5-formylfuran-3-yl)methyl phosphate synthase